MAIKLDRDWDKGKRWCFLSFILLPLFRLILLPLCTGFPTVWFTDVPDHAQVLKEATFFLLLSQSRSNFISITRSRLQLLCFQKSTLRTKVLCQIIYETSQHWNFSKQELNTWALNTWYAYTWSKTLIDLISPAILLNQDSLHDLLKYESTGLEKVTLVITDSALDHTSENSLGIPA